MAREVGNDARARKRERDKQNQRQRRRRERDAFEELQRKNELLEQQVKALRGGNSSDVQSLSDTVQRLESTNKALKERLETVDQFVQSWTIKSADNVSTKPDTSAKSTSQNGFGLSASQMSSPAGTTPIVACKLIPGVLRAGTDIERSIKSPWWDDRVFPRSTRNFNPERLVWIDIESRGRKIRLV